MTTQEAFIGPREHEIDFIARVSPRKLRDFNDWMQRWHDPALTSEERVSLLHVMPMHINDAFPFLLELIEDKHEKIHPKQPYCDSCSCAIKDVQTKAMSVLIQRILKLGLKGELEDDNEPWYTLKTKPELMDNIMCLLERDHITSSLYPQDHEREIVEAFLERFVCMLNKTWEKDHPFRQYKREKAERLVRMLLKHDQSSFITSQHPPMFPLEMTQMILKMLALEKRYEWDKETPRDLLEATGLHDYRGHAARIWFSLDVRRKLHQRKAREERDRERLAKIQSEKMKLEKRLSATT